MEDLPFSPRLTVGLKFWLKGDQKFSMGPGDVKILKSIAELKNLTLAAKKCGYSYKYAWQKLRTLSKTSGHPIVESKKGGYGGGGEVIITPWGKYLIEAFEKVETQFDELLKNMNEEFGKISYDGEFHKNILT